MSIMDFWQKRKIQKLSMARWRPASHREGCNNLVAERRRRLRALIEPMENRCMLSVAALTDNPVAVTSTSFVAGNLLVPQFNTTGGKVLLKAEVQYKVDLASVLAATGTNPTTDPATLQGNLNVFANLSVPGASAGNPAGATNNPQGVTLVASPSVPLPPGSVDVPISYNSETAQPGVGHIDKTLVMTGAQAGAAGYVGAGTNPFARVAGGTATLSIAGGPTGTIVGGWTTTVNFSADPLYYYYVPAAISGIKFEDADFGADKDAGEAGLTGWTINISGTAEDIVDAQLNVLLAGGPVNTSVVTGAGGAYSFTNLGPGTYTITETPQANFINTFPVGGSYTVTIAADGTATVGSLINNDFGNVNPVERANISIGPDDVNEVGDSHVFTATVNFDDGIPAGLFGGDAVSGFAPASGVNVTVALDGVNGAVPDISAPTDLAAADPSSTSGNSNASGQFAVTFTSATAGKVIGNASATVNGIAVDTDPVTATTAGTGGSGPATKRFVDARVSIAPDAVNPVNAPHTFTATVEQDDGLLAAEGGDGVTGFTPIAGANISIVLTNSGGAVANPPGAFNGLTDASGEFDATFTSATAGTVTGNAYATLTIGGVPVARDTDPSSLAVTAGPGGSGPATKVFVQPRAKITIAPDAVNEVRAPHTFIATVFFDDGLAIGAPGGDAVDGFAPISGVNVQVTLDGQNGAIPDISAPVNLPAADPSSTSGNSNASGQFSVTFTSANAGLVIGNAFATVNGIPVDTDPSTLTTAGSGGSGPSTKRFVDARITIAPNAVNPVNAPHTFIATVSQDDGLTAAQGGDGVTGFAPKAGANVTISLTNGGGAVANPAGPFLGVTNASGQFQATFTSATPGTVTGNASTTFVVGGVSLTRDTDPATASVPAGPGGSGPAVKTFEQPPGGATATMGFWHNKNGQAVIKSAANIGTDLATAYPNLFGAGTPAFNTLGAVDKGGPKPHFVNLNGQSASNVALAFSRFFNVTGPKAYAQLMANVLAQYFDQVNNTPIAQQFGFGGNLSNTAIVLSGNQSAVLGLPVNTTVGAYLTRVNTLMAGKAGVIPANLFGVINDVSDMINNLNHV